VNLAFGTILLVILLIPPLTFIYFYSKGTHAKGIPKMSLAEYLFLSAVLSLFLHSAAIHLFKLNVDYQFLVQFISGQFKPEDFERYKPKYAGYFSGFALYTFWLCLFCIGLGFLLRRLITSRRLRMLRWLQNVRLNRKPNDLYCYFNKWWYYFRANEYDSAYAFLGRQEPLVYIDALVDAKDASVIYSGVLHDFVIKGEDLDSIYLVNTTKRLFSQEEKDGESGLPRRNLKNGDEVIITPGGLFCLPYAQILNLHIRFVSALDIEGDDNVNDDELANLLRSGTPNDAALPEEQRQKAVKADR